MTRPIHGQHFMTPLSPEQAEQLEALVQTLTPEQALWVSGYMAGLARQPIGAMPEGPSASPPAEAAAITVLYGSETGNAQDVAQQLESAGRDKGLNISAKSMAEYSVRSLKKEQFVVAVTATHGEGDPPEPAITFFEELAGKKAPKLEGVGFAVLGLGDSTYEHFCEAGKVLDRRFEELGGERLQDRQDLDVDYEEPAEAWIETLVGKLAERAAPSAEGTAGDAAVMPAGPMPAAAQTTPQYDKRHPFPAPVIESVKLTGRGSSKETRHVEVSLEDSGLVYTPGDALGVMPQNDPELAAAIIDALGLDSEAKVPVKDVEVSLREALAHHYEITALTPRFLEFWAEKSESGDLKALLAEDKKDERRAFLESNHVLDVVRQYPVSGLSAEDFVTGLRRLQPRLYSLASSMAAMPDEAHITVGLVNYELNGMPRYGVASGHMCQRVDLDDHLPVYIQENPNFRLPGDGETPIIMIGAGTGVAPYRAFMQERQEAGQKGKSWLFFGERTFRTDFLYQVEWQKYLKDGYLSRISLAFSRDQAEKLYVQHRMKEEAKDLYAWLEDGAHMYLCGDAEKLAPDVEAALHDIVTAEGGMSDDKAQEYIRNLQQGGRFQKDVY